MRISLQDALHLCSDWERFCAVTGISEYAVNEGGGHVEVELTVQEAHFLGFGRLDDWRVDADEQRRLQQKVHG